MTALDVPLQWRLERLRHDGASVVPPRAARAAMAVAHGARTVREVATAGGWSSVSSAYAALQIARRLGLVAWEEGGTVQRRDGTLRANFGIVIGWGPRDAS